MELLELTLKLFHIQQSWIENSPQQVLEGEKLKCCKSIMSQFLSTQCPFYFLKKFSKKIKPGIRFSCDQRTNPCFFRIHKAIISITIHHWCRDVRVRGQEMGRRRASSMAFLFSGRFCRAAGKSIKILQRKAVHVKSIQGCSWAH